MALMFAGLAGVAVPALLWLYGKFGRPWAKKVFDKPETEEDESAVLDVAVELLIKTLVALALKKAKVDGAPVNVDRIASEVVAKTGLPRAEIYKRIDLALGRKSGS